MPSFLVESYLADTPGAVEDARRRAVRTAEIGTDVRHLRTTFVPGDEVVLHFFQAPSAEAIGAAGRQAALAYERIVEAVEEAAPTSEKEER
jgi:hypothetical protein